MSKKWIEYHERVGLVPNSLVVNVLDKYPVNKGVALDLGAGNLRDSRYLRDSGFSRVVAVDLSEESREYATPGIELHLVDVRSYQIQQQVFDLIIACNILFFLTAEEVGEIFEKAFSGLCSGGLFTCNVLGKRDPWVTDGQNVSSFRVDELNTISSRFKILSLGDVYIEATPKDWHMWSLVLQNP